MPDAVGSLQSLEILSVNSNQLTHLPACLDNLTQLKALYANGNALTAWPDQAFVNRDASIGALSSHSYQCINRDSVGMRVNFAATKILEIPAAIQSSWVVLTHLHITDADTKTDGKHVVILSGTPYAAALKK